MSVLEKPVLVIPIPDGLVIFAFLKYGMTLTVSTYQHVLVLKYHSINRVRYCTTVPNGKYIILLIFLLLMRKGVARVHS